MNMGVQLLDAVRSRRPDQGLQAGAVSAELKRSIRAFARGRPLQLELATEVPSVQSAVYVSGQYENEGGAGGASRGRHREKAQRGTMSA